MAVPSTVPGSGNRRGNQNVDATVACQQQYGASARSHYRDYSEPFVLVLLHRVIWRGDFTSAAGCYQPLSF